MKYYTTLGAMLLAGAFAAGAQNILEVNGNVMLESAYTLELGGQLTKEINAGKIGYATFTPGTLDIVGAGTFVSNRKIKFWNEGSATFAGQIHMLSGQLTHTLTGDTKNLLPVGIAGVQAAGTKQYGTSNLTTSWVTDHYEIDMGHRYRACRHSSRSIQAPLKRPQ